MLARAQNLQNKTKKSRGKGEGPGLHLPRMLLKPLNTSALAGCIANLWSLLWALVHELHEHEKGKGRATAQQWMKNHPRFLAHHVSNPTFNSHQIWGKCAYEWAWRSLVKSSASLGAWVRRKIKTKAKARQLQKIEWITTLSSLPIMLAIQLLIQIRRLLENVQLSKPEEEKENQLTDRILRGKKEEKTCMKPTTAFIHRLTRQSHDFTAQSTPTSKQG